MITPQRAPVKPRVVAEETGDSVLLEDVVSAAVENHCCGAIELLGEPGSGKSCALAHLASLPYADRLALIDDADETDVRLAMVNRMVVYTTGKSLELAKFRYRLAAWCMDDLIEYLLATHPNQCASVVARISHDHARDLLSGAPRLYRLVADEMAAGLALADIGSAFRSSITRLLKENPNFDDIGFCAIAMLLDEAEIAARRMQRLKASPQGSVLLGLLRYRPVQIMLAANRFIQAVQQKHGGVFPTRRLPRDLVEEMANLAGGDRQAILALHSLIGKRGEGYAPMIASVLHLADPKWRPHHRRSPDLRGAYFMRAEWAKIDLRQVNLERTDLRRSNLRRARFDKCLLNRAVFRGACLDGARLVEVEARLADFTDAKMRKSDLHGANLGEARFDHANLTQANATTARFWKASFSGATLQQANLESCDFRGASFVDSDLSGANLTGANLRRADLRSASLMGANLAHADLTDADLESVSLPDPQFRDAKLIGATLTASRMPKANLKGAKLCGAKLADIDWPFADLRDADLSGCTFHFGSSRSGLVGSPYPGHGSKTSFYSDDFGEQTHKAPEEIRKANLRGADLRGAQIENTDFYLVDLRGARYDPDQAEHFRRCDAILCDRSP